jgi:hypothetical protein
MKKDKIYGTTMTALQWICKTWYIEFWNSESENNETNKNESRPEFEKELQMQIEHIMHFRLY